MNARCSPSARLATCLGPGSGFRLGSPRARMGTLKVISGPAAGQSLEVDRELTIGREEAALTGRDEQMSRRHAVVRPVDDGIAVRDLGSRNGTFVNGSRVDGETTLRANGRLQLGDTEIAVELPEPAAAAVAERP